MRLCPSQFNPAPRARAIAALLTLLLITAACSGGNDLAVSSADDTARNTSASNELSVETAASSDKSFEPERSQAVTQSESDSISEGAQAATTGAAGSEAAAQLADLGRDIIYTATLEIASTDVAEATRTAIRAVESRGGFLFAQETSGGATGSSTLTFKILPAQFQSALNELGSVGEIRSQSISADDVTAVVVDLESRINTSEASVVRLRDLLDNASELETIATLESQLLQRETTLEQLRGQLRTVQKQVDLATITVRVVELLNRPGIAVRSMAYAGHDAGFSCFDTPGIRSVEADAPVTVCYEITNTGDTPLVDLQFDDPALGATTGSLVVVDGSVTTIDPGVSVLLAHEVELPEPVRVRTSVTAAGLDADGDSIEERVEATTATLRFDVLNDDELPGFGEVLSSSWDALVTALAVIALIAVAVAPFAAVAALFGTPIWWLIRRRIAARPPRPVYAPPASSAPPASPAPPTPPTPPTAPPVDATAV